MRNMVRHRSRPPVRSSGGGAILPKAIRLERLAESLSRHSVLAHAYALSLAPRAESCAPERKPESYAPSQRAPPQSRDRAALQTEEMATLHDGRVDQFQRRESLPRRRRWDKPRTCLRSISRPATRYSRD